MPNMQAPNNLLAASPTPTPTPAPTPTLLTLATGQVTGLAGQFTPLNGDSATGGASQVVDGIDCEPMVTTYHVHAHLSVFVNGVRYAVPYAIGIYKPGALVSGFISTGSCFYHIHTHDADGYIHLEAPAPTTFTLGNLFDIWGQTLTSGDVAGFGGPMLVYTAQGPTNDYHAIASDFTPYTGDPRNIDLMSHEEVVLEIGPTFVKPPYIPPVEFYTQY